MSKQVQLFISYFFMSGILLTMVSCRRTPPQSGIPQLVKITEVKQHNGLYTVTYPGKIEAVSDVKLAFRVAGPIKKIYVGEGEQVKKGKLLAEIDPRDYQLQYEAAEAEYKQVKGESERVIELYRRGSVPVNEYDKAEASIKRVTVLYEAQRNALNDTRLKAPFDGYIQKKYFDTYEIVNQGLPVLSMIDDGRFEVNIDIPSGDYIRRGSFTGFYCIADVYPDMKLPLDFIDINRKANFNQLFKVRFLLKKDKHLKLAVGMSVSVTIQYTPVSEELTILPISALVRKKEQSFVWLYDRPAGGTVKAVPVEVRQLLKDGEVMVKSTLLPGQTVVSAGVNSLKEGQRVNVLPAIPDSNVGGLL